MNLARYMVVRDIPKAKALVCYSSHRTAAKAFSMMDKRRRELHLNGLYVRDKWLGKRVRRSTLGEPDDR